jgi:predicted nucleic acid-binding protein
MAVVVDANLPIVLVSKDPRKQAVLSKFMEWIEQGVPLHAPQLMQYEIANALTRLITAKVFSESDLAKSFEYLSQLPIIYHPLSQEERVVSVALLLKRQSAYDAAYIVLAETLNAELWTLDSPLYRNAVSQGFPVKFLAETE